MPAGYQYSIDTNYDPTEQWEGGIVDVLSEVDIFLPNETELLGIARSVTWRAGLAQLAQYGPTVAVKRGSQGAAAQQGDFVVQTPTPTMSVIDSTGAGDSFDAGFVYGFLAGWPLQRTLTFASVCGALSTRAIGGTDAQPTLSEALAHLDALTG